jgi:hypothetical protein
MLTPASKRSRAVRKRRAAREGSISSIFYLVRGRLKWRFQRLRRLKSSAVDERLAGRGVLFELEPGGEAEGGLLLCRSRFSGRDYFS